MLWWHHLLFWLMIVAVAYVYVRHALPGFRMLGGPVRHDTPGTDDNGRK